MSDPLMEEDKDATPLTEEERQQLIPSYITLRAELNEAEQRNILQAEAWAFRRKRHVPSEEFLKRLHKRMFGSVWRWAGEFRQFERNIGVPAYRISMDLRQLLDDCQYRMRMDMITNCFLNSSALRKRLKLYIHCGIVRIRLVIYVQLIQVSGITHYWYSL